MVDRYRRFSFKDRIVQFGMIGLVALGILSLATACQSSEAKVPIESYHKLYEMYARGMHGLPDVTASSLIIRGDEGMGHATLIQSGNDTFKVVTLAHVAQAFDGDGDYLVLPGVTGYINHAITGDYLAISIDTRNYKLLDTDEKDPLITFELDENQRKELQIQINEGSIMPLRSDISPKLGDTIEIQQLVDIPPTDDSFITSEYEVIRVTDTGFTAKAIDDGFVCAGQSGLGLIGKGKKLLGLAASLDKESLLSVEEKKLFLPSGLENLTCGRVVNIRSFSSR